MQQLPYETLHVDDFKIVGYLLDAVALIEVDEDAVEKRSIALIQENVARSNQKTH